MYVIVLTATKGGSGKSTLAECLAVEAVRSGSSVYLCDLDPQQSTASWWKRRGAPAEPLLVAGAASVSEAVTLIKRRRLERDFLIVDSPGSFIPVIADAINSADCIVLVTQPSPKDLEGQAAAEELVAKYGRESDTVYVINRAVRQRGALLAQVLDIVEAKTANEVCIVRDLQDFVRADQRGQTANEINADARQEIQQLWKVIQGIANEKGKVDERGIELKAG